MRKGAGLPASEADQPTAAVRSASPTASRRKHTHLLPCSACLQAPGAIRSPKWLRVDAMQVRAKPAAAPQKARGAQAADAWS